MGKIYRTDLQIFADIINNHVDEMPNRMANKICKTCKWNNEDCNGICANTIMNYLKNIVLKNC